jgi:uncharacterized protein YfdQ (DUF2303 family)
MMSEAQKVAELAEAACRQPTVMVIEHNGVQDHVLLLPSEDGGYARHLAKELLKEHMPAPDRRKGQANLTDLASFIAHVVRFKDEDSAIFADRSATSPALLAVLDYHRQGADGAPRFGQHRARYAFPLSDEWTAWKGSNGKPFGQEEFARFIEDKLASVADPAIAGEGAKVFADLLSCGFASASKLLELSRGLTVHVGRRIVNHANLSTGEATLSFAEEHADTAGKPIKVPGAFLLALPVFRGGAHYQVAARLRYRVKGSEVVWSYELYRAEAIFDHAIGEACEIAQKATGLPLFLGTPEPT